MTKITGVKFLAGTMMLASAFPVFAQSTTTRPVTSKTVDVACIKTAIDTRDIAVGSALDTMYNARKTALQARTTALKAAWDLTDRTARKKALRDAWNKFGKDTQAANRAYRDAQRAGWKKFNDSRKACGPHAVSDDNTTEGVDNR